ncbi:uncharacterized protein ACRADG_007492 [Cochliomyia hominivorax]
MFVIISLLLIFSLLPHCLCIVNRDLVLTPKQGLQLSGKRIFYEESYNNDNNAAATTNNLHHNDSIAEVGLRPWERTLKHVTYLTLFTNAANGIITGNFSKVKEYNDFLSSAYVRSPNPLDSRFGDIVTLAQGRLETTTNGTYQFVEGNCDYECARDSNIIAMWHVQKIRHRDTADRKYHYEMKFSVSPLTAKAPTETVVRGGPNKRTIMEEQRNNVQTFIQKEDDYPLSFRKLVSDKDEDFTDRRYEAARNFRQVSQPHYQTQQVTPIPQSTFLRGVYHHPPPPPHHVSPTQMQLHNQHLQQRAQLQHHPHHIQQQQLPLPERLNIGEFYKGNYIPKGPAKVDVFPNLLNMFMNKPQHNLPPPQPTTFRPPTIQMKFPRPEIYTLQQHQLQELPKFPEYHHPHPPPHLVQDQFTQRTPAAVPMVTHHYHHHYFMPNNSAITLEQIVHNQQSEEHNQAPSAEIYHNEVTEVATPQGYITNLYEESHATSTLKQPHFPQPQHHPQVHYHANIQRQNYHANDNVNYQFSQPVPPAPQKFVFPNTQIEQQRVIHVTSAPPLKKPQYQSQTQTQHQTQYHQQYFENPPITSSLEYTTVHVPLLISYPAPINEEERSDIPTPRNKPFIQSDPMDEIVRYSEPDPLYAHVNEAEIANEQKYLANEENSQQVGTQEPQLESPQNYDQQRKNQKQTGDEPDNKREHSESIEAQLPAPNKNVSVKDEVKTFEEIKPKVPEQSTSQSTTTIKIADEKTTVKSIKTEASNSIINTTKRPKIFPLRNKRINFKSSTTTTAKPSTISSTTTVAPKTSSTMKPQKSFVSTSTTESPLKTIGRYRNSYTRTSSTSTTTTEKPVLKWTPKRKFINNKFLALKSTTTPAAKEIIKETEDEVDDDDVDDDVNNNETDNNDNEYIKTNESNNLVTSKVTQSTTAMPTTTPEIVAETTTQISNDITIGTTSTISSLLSSSSSLTPPTTSPLFTETSQDETEIYEVLTQKSVSKSVSLKVGYNGEEIPVIVDDEENEVKKI